MPGWTAFALVAGVRLLEDVKQLSAAWTVAHSPARAAPDPGPPGDPISMLLGSILWWGLLLGAAWLVWAALYRRPWYEPFGLAWPKSTRRFMACLAAGLGLVALLVWALTLAPLEQGQDTPMKRIFEDPQKLQVLLVFALLLAPVFEELLFRGFFYGMLERRIGVGGALAVVTVWFGLMHVWQHTSSEGVNWLAVWFITAAGLIFGLMRVSTGSSVGSIICHYAYNYLIALGLPQG